MNAEAKASSTRKQWSHADAAAAVYLWHEMLAMSILTRVEMVGRHAGSVVSMVSLPSSPCVSCATSDLVPVPPRVFRVAKLPSCVSAYA